MKWLAVVVRAYYAERKGKFAHQFDFVTLKRLIRSVYAALKADGYFDQSFGYYCVDAGDIHGSLGRDLETAIFLHVGKSELWPIEEKIGGYDEDELFTVIEFLYDHVSKPISGHMHDFSNCGMHWETFDPKAGRVEFRLKTNAVLGKYGDGYELSEAGEIVELGPSGMRELLKADISIADLNVQGRVQSAIAKYRERKSTANDRRDAVRDLADVLEYLRPQLKAVINSKDESDLFHIANQFGIRHYNSQQKMQYDPSIWLSWMFYFYLATIHASLRLIEKKSS